MAQEHKLLAHKLRRIRFCIVPFGTPADEACPYPHSRYSLLARLSWEPALCGLGLQYLADVVL